MRRPQVLFRVGSRPEARDEFAAARRHLADTVRQRTECGPGTVVGRYSVLPYYDELERDLAAAGLAVARQAAARIAPHVPFFVVDVAETEAGPWRVVEVNDGQMSGLSTIDPDRFYAALAAALAECAP
jgi:hypothetical protein